MNTSVGAMYNDLQGLGVDVAELKLKANTAIAFMDNFLVIDRSRCKTTAKERTVLAHEAGHYLSGAFYLAYSPYEIKEQAENRRLRLRLKSTCRCLSCARLWPVDSLSHGSWRSISALTKII